MGHDPWSELRAIADQARRSIESTLHVSTPGVLEEAPEDRGLFALAAHPWAKELRASPTDIAARAARVAVPLPFEPLQAAGPYVNFRVDPAAFGQAVLESVRLTGDRYGASPPRKERILLEHTSANPTGPLHVGRARNPFLGDSLGRLLRYAGHPVTREYFVNDIGRQMVLLYWAVTNLKPEPGDEGEERIERRYVRLYQRANDILEKDPRIAKEIDALIQRFEGGDADLTRAIRAVGDRILRQIVEVLARLGVAFDSFFWESDLILDGSVRKVIDRLLPLSKEEDGGHYLDLSASGIEGDAAKYFFVTRHGTSLYTTRDIAYHLRKKERADVAINVLGEDQKLSFLRLKATFRLMGIDWAPETIFYAFVSLPEGRMSTRKGRVVYIDDLIEEARDRAYEEVSRRRPDLSEERKAAIAETIGLGALRYNIVRVQAEKGITFRWEEALNFEGNSAPFLQYAHARACSILAKAGPDAPGEARLLLHPEEQRLLRWLAKFPSVVREAADGRRVHAVAAYAADFAAQFNVFYRDCPVLTAEPVLLREARIDLVDASRIVLQNALDCLGVKAPKEM
jgi:arginyl-tRNA synthetase